MVFGCAERMLNLVEIQEGNGFWLKNLPSNISLEVRSHIEPYKTITALN
jgi:hypothetical protein